MKRSWGLFLIPKIVENPPLDPYPTHAFIHSSCVTLCLEHSLLQKAKVGMMARGPWAKRQGHVGTHAKHPQHRGGCSGVASKKEGKREDFVCQLVKTKVKATIFGQWENQDTKLKSSTHKHL